MGFSMDVKDIPRRYLFDTVLSKGDRVCFVQEEPLVHTLRPIVLVFTWVGPYPYLWAFLLREAQQSGSFRHVY